MTTNEKLPKLPLRRELMLYYHGIGDSLLFSTVLYHLGKQNGERFLVGSLHPEIYRGNPYVRHIPLGQRGTYKLAKLLKAIGWARAVTHINYHQDGPIPKKHLLQLLADRVGLKEAPLRPMMFFSEAERAEKILPASTKPWIAIQSTGNSTWTDNKNWGVERFVKVAGMLSSRYALVQIGSPSDPALPVDLNLCGRMTVRQSFQVLSECSGFVGQVGFLMHVATVMSVPSVIVYGGFEAPWQGGYDWNVNLYNPVPCAPCYLATLCPYGKKCLTEIQPEQVVLEVEKLVKP